MAKQISLLSFNKLVNFLLILVLCIFSITKIISAHSIKSPEIDVSASALVPALMVLIPAYSANTASAVGLRKRFSVQTNNRLI